MCSARSHPSGEVQPRLTGAPTELDRRWLGRGSCRHLCPIAGSAPELGAQVDSVQSLLVPSVTSLPFWAPRSLFCSGKIVLLIIIMAMRMTTPYVCKALSIFRNTFAPLISLDFPIIPLRLVGPPHCAHFTDLVQGGRVALKVMLKRFLQRLCTELLHGPGTVGADLSQACEPQSLDTS